MNQSILLDKCYAGMLLGAVGDALGWPYENPSRTVGLKTFKPGQLQAYQRRMGSRGILLTKLEDIESGAYSDDTQMSLMVARSLLAKEEDVHFKSELVYWINSKYHRGAGRRVKAAASAYESHTTPWNGEKADLYFEAGSNGGIMRQFPIVIQHRLDDTPEALVHHLVHHVVLTHGHPAAIIGAIVIGLVQLRALQQPKPADTKAWLNYLLDNQNLWTALPIEEFPMGWLDCYQNTMKQDYRDLWNHIAATMVDKIKTLLTYVNQGSSEDTILQELAIHRLTRGSGIITVMGVLSYLIHYQDNPVEGLIRCAMNTKLDCDTVASILGTILGAIHGTSMIPSHWYTVQDAPYIQQLAEYLLAENPQQAYDDATEEALAKHPDVTWQLTPLGPTHLAAPKILADFKTTTTYQQDCYTVLGQTFHNVYRKPKR